MLFGAGVWLSVLVGEVVPGAHADLCDLVEGSSGVVRAAIEGEGPGAKLVTA